MRKHIAILPSFIAIAICFAQLITNAHAENQMSGNAIRGNGKLPATYFTNGNFLNCGERDVLITTTCTDVEEALTYCFNQNISIYSAKDHTAFVKNYNYSFDEGNQQFIARAACVSSGSKEYLILESTNFGNCDICEWIDVYLPSGKYVGSSSGMYDTKNFKHYPLPKQLDSLLSTDHAKEISSVTVSRVRSGGF